MHPKEINKTKTPELFYSCQDTELNWRETETLLITGGVQLRKRCKNGWQDILLRYGALQLYFIPEKTVTTTVGTGEDEITISETVPDESNAKLVADGILIPQIKVDGTWTNMSFTSIVSTLETGDTDAKSIFSNGTDTVTIDFKWRIGDSKQTYTLQSSVGNTVRMAAIVNDYREDVEVKQDFSDYLGLTAVEVQTDQDDLLSTKYVFESDGKVLSADEPVFVVDPYLTLAEVSTTITVYTDDDTLVFTKATYDATLTEGSSVRVVITETNLVSTIYRDVMLQYGTGSSSVSGLTYSAQNISTNFDWFPLTSGSYGNRTAITSQYQNPSELDITTGTAVTSGTGHTSIGTDGFASDGAYHVEGAGDDGDEVLFELGQIEHKPSIVLQDFPYQTGNTDYLKMNLPLTSAEDTTKFYDKVSDSNIGSGADSDVTFSADGALFDSATDYLMLTSAEQSTLGLSYNKGSITFAITPTVDIGGVWCYILYGNSSGDRCILRIGYDSIELGIGENYTYYIQRVWNLELVVGVTTVISCLWDVSIPYAQVTQNKKVVDIASTSTFTAFGSSIPMATTLYIGNQSTNDADYLHSTLKDLRWFSEPILPYGAYFTGNSGADQLAYAHKDITYFNSDGTSLDIGVTSYSTVAGNIDADEGSMSLWFDPDDYSSDTDLFGAASTLMIEWDGSDSDILFTYGSASIRTTSTLSGGDNHIKVTWEASGEITLERNGVAETAVSASTAPSLDASFTIDSDITDIYITSDKGTPQIPCAGKIALDMPIVRND